MGSLPVGRGICHCIILSTRNTLYSYRSVHTTRVNTDRSLSNAWRIASDDVYVIKTTDIYIFSTDYKFVVALCITKTLLYARMCVRVYRVYYSGFSLGTLFFFFCSKQTSIPTHFRVPTYMAHDHCQTYGRTFIVHDSKIADVASEIDFFNAQLLFSLRDNTQKKTSCFSIIVELIIIISKHMLA